ncbi:hypothetical protein KIPB_016396, partial [Kipferlia bialata]
GPDLINSIIRLCDRNRDHYKDHTFPPNQASLNRIPKKEALTFLGSGRTGWKRLGDCCEKPVLFGDTVSSEDVPRGEGTSVWLRGQLSALAANNGRSI